MMASAVINLPVQTMGRIPNCVQYCREVLDHSTIRSQEILRSYDKLIQSVCANNIFRHDLKRLCSAIEFAAVKHQFQKRKDKGQTPYIIHPIGVARILIEEGRIADINALIIAVLHDTLEDTKAMPDDIESSWGYPIRKAVEDLSDKVNPQTGLKVDTPEARKQAEIDKAPTLSYKASIVKLADKIYNMRDLISAPPDWTNQRFYKYASDSEQIVTNIKNHNFQESITGEQEEGLKKLVVLAEQQVRLVQDRYPL